VGERLKLNVMGLTFLVTIVALIVLIIWLVPGVVGYLTTIPETSKTALEAIKGVVATAGAQGAGNPAVTPLSLDTLVALEYESMMLRIEGIQAALGFVSGIIFIPSGLVLFAAGIAGGFRFQGKLPSFEFRMVAAAPGLFLILIGGILIGLAVTKDVRRTFDYSNRLDRLQQVITQGGRTPPRQEPTGTVPQ
jgi:hypothetical protein